MEIEKHPEHHLYYAVLPNGDKRYVPEAVAELVNEMQDERQKNADKMFELFNHPVVAPFKGECRSFWDVMKDVLDHYKKKDE